MLDSISVPRRPFDFEDYIDILRRNIGWIIAPAFAGMVIATVVAFMMQDTFVSTALIRVTPQQISTDIIKTTLSQDIADRINGMTQTILSRGTLTSLINSFGLYKDDLKSSPMEDVVEKMHRSISVVPVGGSSMGEKFLPAMQVAFAYSDKYTAQKVCNDLVSRFMNLSTSDMVQSHQEAQQFLKDQFDDAKRDLDELERKLSDFQTQNAGHLPEEMQTNMQQMNSLDGRFGSLTEAANRNQEQRMLLENELRIAKQRMAAIHTSQAQGQNQRVAALDQQIENQENLIAAMKERYTDDYPDLQGAKDTLAFLKRQRDAASKEKPKIDPAATTDNPAVARDRMEAQDQIDRIQTQLKTNAIDAQQISRDTAAVNSALRTYQSRLGGVPTGVKQYLDLQRDRELAKARYVDAKLKLERSNVSIDMERRKQGETLELLDSASLPAAPTAPKRRMILPTGILIGFLIGVVLVAVREVRDTSLKNLKDARLYTQLTILGSIPLLENDVVVQRRKQVMWVGWATATLVGLAVMAGSVVHYYISLGKG
jgi:polysaccharide chain length determinant protein (PEP-CTERM system associated)